MLGAAGAHDHRPRAERHERRDTYRPDRRTAANCTENPMDAAAETSMLEPAERPESPHLRASAEHFVAAVDRERLEVAGGPFGLLTRTLPFLQVESSEDLAQWMPLRCVIGMSWRWTKPEPRPGREDLSGYLLAPARADRTDPDAASGWWVPDIGVGAMHEGKNRVRYLRDTCGAELMPASVTILRFPSANRLQLLRAEAGAGEFYTLLLDRRWLTVLKDPALSLPLLRAYGIHPEPWPSRLPAIDELLGSRAWESYAHGTPSAIDVEAWHRRTRAQYDRLAGEPFDILDSSPHWPGFRRLAWSAVGGGLLGGVLTALSGGHLGVVGVAALTTGGLLALTIPLIRAPRSVWKRGHGVSGSDGVA